MVDAPQRCEAGEMSTETIVCMVAGIVAVAIIVGLFFDHN